MGKYCRQHIGKTFNDGKITVVDGGDSPSYFKVKCIVCSEDSELYGDAVFETTFNRLKLSQLPCGCAKAKRFSAKQHEIKIKRIINSLGLQIDLVSVPIEHKNILKQDITLFCLKAQKEYTCNLGNFYNGGGHYGIQNSSKGYCKSLEDCIKEFNELNSSAVVWEIPEVSEKKMLGYYCKVCQQNGYEYIYTTQAQSVFTKGCTPCRCSSQYQNFTPDEYIDRARELLVSNKINAEVVGYLPTKERHLVLICPHHGLYKKSVSNFKVNPSCVKCNPPKSGYKRQSKGFLYVLDILVNDTRVVGYGISNVVYARLRDHKRNLKTIGATITNIQVFEGSGTAVLAVENDIKSLHTTGLLDCEGFRRESISIDRKDEVLEKCKKLKVLDNVDKLI